MSPETRGQVADGTKALPQAPAPRLDIGSPPIRVFEPETYAGLPQTWATEIAGSGALYLVCSGNGLRRFDGSAWTVLESNDQLLDITRSDDGQIFYAGVRDLGVVVEGPDGAPHLSSLIDQVKGDLAGGRVFHQVLSHRGRIWFVSRDRVLAWDGSTFTGELVGEDSAWFSRLHRAGSELFAWRPGLGIQQLIDERFVTLPASADLKDRKISGIAAAPSPDAILCVDRIGPVFEVPASVTDKDTKPTIRVDLSAAFAGLQARTTHQLDDGRILVGTLSHGLLELAPDGAVQRRISERDGLPSDIIRAIDGRDPANIYLSTTNGLALVDLESPLRSIGRSHGLRDQVRALHRTPSRSFLATTVAVHELIRPRPGEFELRAIEGSGSGWDLVQFGGRILTVGASELLVLEGDKFVPAIDLDASILRISGDRLYALGRAGAFRIRWDGDSYEAEKLELPLMNGSKAVWDLETGPDGRTWITSNEGLLVVRLVEGDPTEGKPNVQLVASWRNPDPATNGGPSLIARSGRAPLILSGRDVLEWDPTSGRQPDPIAEWTLPPGDEVDRGRKLPGDPYEAPAWADACITSEGSVWLLSPRALYRSSEAAPETLERIWDLGSSRYSFLNMVPDALDESILCITTDEDLRLLDTKRLRRPRRVAGLAPHLDVTTAAGEPLADSIQEPATLFFSARDLPIDIRGDYEFRWRMPPLQNEWTTWSRKPKREFERLGHGDYLFELESRSPSLGPLERVSRRVLVRRSPWSSPWAWAGYAFLLSMIGVLGAHFASRRLRRRNEHLSLEVEERTRDLAERTEEAERNAERASATFTSSPAALLSIQVDRDKRNPVALEAQNHAAIKLLGEPTGVSGEERLGSLFGSAWAEVAAGIRSVVTDGASLEISTSGGEAERHLRISIHRTPTDADDRTMVQLAIVDETERLEREKARQALEEQMSEAQRLESIGLLAGGLAHDFNNLMTSVLGNAGFLQDSEDANRDPEERAALASIEEAAVQAGDLCKQMLAYAGRGTLSLESVEIEPLVDRAIRLVKSQRQRAMDFRLRSDGPGITVQGDPTQLCQVLLNMLTNAVEALEDESAPIEVLISERSLNNPLRTAGGLVLAEGPYVQVTVADRGCGMDEETRARLFDPFFSSKFQGRGLGLSAALGIVKRHGGGLVVESEKGTGTKIDLLLPSTRSTPQSTGAHEESPGRSELRIALCDDQASVLKATSRILESHGHEVHAFADGQSLLDRLADSEPRLDPDLFLIDWVMPGPHGSGLIRLLRQARPGVPIVVVSGFQDTQTFERTNEEPVEGFLPKPFSGATLDEVLRRACR